ncbi:MAG TPA: glycosyltransferase family 1 protein [Bryobacteraceae bacterium]|nr:glycosyltransferase family 1 protein [Bryobacteraceae bacterium]
MRFAVDAHAIGRNLTGNEVYVRSLLREFAELDRASEFIACISEPDAERWIPERFDVRHVSADPFRRLGWDLGRAVKAARADVLHVQYTAPLGVRVPVIVTVHDVSFLEHPAFFTLARRQQLCFTVRRTVKTSARIITVSEFSRRAILRHYDIPADKVHVVPNAANPYFRVTSHDRARRAVRDRLDLDAPFIFSVGDLQPRKNHIRLIEAFARLLSAHPKLNHHLVLTGKDTWFGEKIRLAAANSGVANRIHFTGFVDDSELLDLYNACDCLVFPSLYEGFGLPVLEAHACGRAVACSQTSAIPEVADGACALFNPADAGEITRAMADILLDPELRARLERLGLKNAARFNWRSSASATLDVYRDVVAGHAAVPVAPVPAALPHA